MLTDPATHIRAGTTVEIKEKDYLYGTGDLRLRVVHAADNRHPMVEWIRMVGVQIRWDGSDGEGRDVLVRATALRAALATAEDRVRQGSAP
jgi:hypothetical protein